jgi:hypothetical protein
LTPKSTMRPRLFKAIISEKDFQVALALAIGQIQPHEHKVFVPPLGFQILV